MISRPQTPAPNWLSAVLASGLGLQLALALLPGTCHADARTAATYYEDAVGREAEGDSNGAILQLKNALLEQPGLLPALLLLGRIHVDSGQGAEAETALQEARRLGADNHIVTPLLARALLMQFKHEQVIKEIRPGDFPPVIAAELHAVRGQAQLETHRLGDAEKSFREAIAGASDRIDGHLGLSKVQMQRGELEAAAASVAAARAIAPDSSEVWNHLASVKHARGELDGALADYAEALRLNPDNSEARIARLSILLDLRRDEEAHADLLALEEVAGRDPRVAYLDALRLARVGDGAGAREKLMRSVGVLDAIREELIDRNVQLLMLGGLVNHALEQFEKSKGYLERVIAVAPEMSGARKLLGSILLTQGKSDQALNVLVEAERRSPRDPQLLSLLGSAYMERGLHDRAAAVLRRAVDATNAPALKTQLGVARILAGDSRLGVEELDAVIRANSGDGRAGLLLALKFIEDGEAGRALTLLENLLQQQPANPVLLNLRGTAQRMLGDTDTARASFEAAAAAAPDFLPARINLARLSELSGEPEQARAQLEALARSFPDDRDLLLARSRLARNLGQIGEAAQYLDRLRALFPDDVPVRVAQVELDLEGGDVARALKYAEELAARFPEDLVALETLGRAQVVAQRPGDARVTFRRMSDRVGFDARWQVRIAAHQRSVAADDDARHSLTKAVQADPSYAAGQRDLAVLELQTGHPERARELAEKMLEGTPEDLIARQIEADALLALGQAEAARSAYQTVFEQEPNLPRALGLARAEAMLGNPSAAADILAGWYSQHPDDDFAGLALAEFRSQAGERQVAIGIYEQLLVRNPESPAVLNNLAQLLAGEDNTRALEMARKAVELVPGDPNLLDTLGWLLVSADSAEEGLRYLREARSREAGNPTHAYHLAVALERLGRNDEARRTLEPLLRSGGDFPEREAARALLDKLSIDLAGSSAETSRHTAP